MVGCGVVPQERLEPVGGTRDLASKEQRLYVQEIGDDQYCVLMESKTDKSTQLLTEGGALDEKQLRKWLIYAPDWYFVFVPSFFHNVFYNEVEEYRLAALQTKDVNFAVTTKRFNKIVARIRNAKPETSDSSCDRFLTRAGK